MALGRLGKYERVDVLGHGSSGIVYLAWDTLLKRQVALKEVDLQAADVERFLDEARLMDRLAHPNIVRVNAVDRIDGRVVIDMEYVRGRNLQDRLRVEGPVPLDEALSITAQVLDALDYAHRLKTVHRDIKPANILVGRDGSVKLADFGLAEVLATNAYACGAGTYAYMAPEDFAEEHNSDHRSDLWAVGASLYEMLTGERPFRVGRVRDPFAWRRALLEQRPRPLVEMMPDAPPALQTIIDKALAVDKHDRYASAAEFRDDVLAVAAGRALVHASIHGAEPRPSPAPPSHAGVATLAPATTITMAPPVVETVAPDAGDARRPFSIARLAARLSRRAPTAVSVSARPESVTFPAVRKGDTMFARVRLVPNGASGVHGRLSSTPTWLEATPIDVRGRRPVVRLKLLTERVWETGHVDSVVVFDTSCGKATIPVSAEVLPARPSFASVAFWFVPALACALFPSLIALLGTILVGTRHLAPAAAVVSAGLLALLLRAGSEADLGPRERAVAGGLLAAMMAVVGAAVGAMSHGRGLGYAGTMLAGGAMVSAVLVAQAVRPRLWKLWVFVTGALGLATGILLARVISLY